MHESPDQTIHTLKTCYAHFKTVLAELRANGMASPERAQQSIVSADKKAHETLGRVVLLLGKVGGLMPLGGGSTERGTVIDHR